MSAFGKTIERREDYPAGRGATTAHLFSAPCIKPSRYFHWKGPLDRCAAAVLLVPGLPLILLLMALVRLTSPGPGIYRQARVGKDGRRFMIYKIRTMRHDAEVKTGPRWTAVNDPRVTPVGWLLRKLHLDELPQLFNVIRGEMALVGPRPERPEFVCVLAEAVPGYRNRLAVLPGITGLAQINLPPDTDLLNVQRKVVLDCEYIERGGPWLDTRLMVCTFLRLFKLPEGWLHKLFALSRDPKVHCPLTTDPVGASESPVETEAATPASILLQLATLPDPAAPAADYPLDGNEGSGESPAERAGPLRNGNGSSRRDGVEKRRGKRLDNGKPR